VQVAEFRTDASLALAAAGENVAELSRKQGKAEEAIRYCTAALALVEPVLQREPELAAARSYVLALHGTRAEANQALERYRAAVEDYDHVVALADAESRDHFRVDRSVLLADAGEKHRARTEADDLSAKAGLSEPDLFNLALVYGLLVQGETGQPSERGAGDRAIALLGRLQKSGFLKQKIFENLLRTAPEFNSLRDRKEFQQIIQSLSVN
jgi:tetratricopeptide (TPR) repeat protein